MLSYRVESTRTNPYLQQPWYINSRIYSSHICTQPQTRSSRKKRTYPNTYIFMYYFFPFSCRAQKSWEKVFALIQLWMCVTYKAFQNNRKLRNCRSSIKWKRVFIGGKIMLYVVIYFSVFARFHFSTGK